MSEKMAEPKNIPHNWDYQSEFHTVTCGGCSFRYGAEHPDSDGWWTCPNCGNGNNPARASSPAQEPVTTEPVAWTNEAQLGFLKEPGYRVVPMAMWAFQHSAHPIALYAIPAPPQPGREDSDLEDLVAQAIWEECCPGMKWGQIDHLIYCRMAGAAIARIRALTGEPK